MTSKITSANTALIITAALAVTIAFGILDPGNFIPKSKPTTPPAMTAAEIIKAAEEATFKEKMIKAAIDNLTSPEHEQGFKEGKKVGFDAFTQEHILPWVALGGVTSTYVYMDEGNEVLSSPAGRKQRYDFWTGYAAAIHNKALGGIRIVAQPCNKEYCALLVTWPESTFED